MKYWFLFLLMGCGLAIAGEPVSSSQSIQTESWVTDEFTNINGSPEALKRLSLMLEKLGGRKLWANARSLQLIQRTRSAKIGSGMLSISWHDLESPGEWVDIQHPRFNLRYAWSESKGWLRREGKYQDFEKDELAEKAHYWERDLYTLYQQLAADEIPFIVKPLKPFGFYVVDPEGEKLGEFHLSSEGELHRWRLLGGKKGHSLVFGAYQSFQNSRFPGWMASDDGRWSAQQIEVLPSSKSFREQVSLKKPVRDWEGGAIQSNCEN